MALIEWDFVERIQLTMRYNPNSMVQVSREIV